ncbi:MAG TPA: DUF3105 domain-containing protein [Thermoleophilaceae bacterium]|nr:DUF3105 domain-containing protein [Thermoleophilaceae bacterium]
MARRKGEKEALRRERELREAEAKAAQRRKRLVGYGGGGLLAIAAIAAIALLAAGGNGAEGQGGGDIFPEGGEVAEQSEFDLEAAAEAAGCELSSKRGTGVADHTTTLDEKVDYQDNPPTNGRHYQIPAEDGLYHEAPTDEQLVHTLEHGRVIVWVKPSVSEEGRQAIRALFDEDDYQMVVVPRSKMEPAIAATAWNRDPDPGGTGRTLACPRWSENVADAIRTFRDEHRSNGPEPIP